MSNKQIYVNAITDLIASKEDLSIGWLPYMCVSEIEEIIKTFRDSNDKEKMFMDRNWWDLDWWYEFSIGNRWICIHWSAYNQSDISLAISDEQSCSEEIW